MLIPALFVADAVRSRLPASASHYDVILFSQAPEVSKTHTSWMRKRGIIFRNDMDMSRLSDVKKVSGRLTAAAPMKLSLAEHLAGESDRLLYLDSDLTIHDDAGRIFSLDTGPFEIAASPSGRILIEATEKKRQETLAHFKTLCMSESATASSTAGFSTSTSRNGTGQSSAHPPPHSRKPIGKLACAIAGKASSPMSSRASSNGATGSFVSREAQVKVAAKLRPMRVARSFPPAVH